MLVISPGAVGTGGGGWFGSGGLTGGGSGCWVHAPLACTKRYTLPARVPAYSLVGEAKHSARISSSSLSFSRSLAGMDCHVRPKSVLIHGRSEPNASKSACAGSVWSGGLPTRGG